LIEFCLKKSLSWFIIIINVAPKIKNILTLYVLIWLRSITHSKAFYKWLFNEQFCQSISIILLLDDKYIIKSFKKGISLSWRVKSLIKFFRWALTIQSAEKMGIFAPIIETTTAWTAKHRLFFILLVQAFSRSRGKLFSNSAIVMIEVFHLAFEFIGLSFMSANQLFNFFPVLIIYFVQIDLAYRVKSDRWCNFFL